jgi:dTDP-4-dehydrorhamnose reductase
MSLYDSILITGAGGMLGHALADALSARGVPSMGLTREQLDVADPSSAERVFTQYKPTLLLNCAAHTKVDLCEQEESKADAINGRAVGNLARLCRASETCLVHVSTDFVFDGALRRPYRADDPVNPLSAYGRSKLRGETELKKNAPERWLIVRTAWVYGRHGANFPRTMVQAAKAGKPLTVVNDQLGSPTHTPDLADAILRLLDTSARGIWHVTNSGQTTWYDFAKATLARFGVSAEIGPLTSAQWKEMRPASAIRPGYSVLDTTPYTRQTGHTLRPWAEALAEFHKAVQQNGF